MKTKRIPRIGVGVIAENSDGLMLLGKRKNAHGEGDWEPPGGHLEFGETPIECAIRELKEENLFDTFHKKISSNHAGHTEYNEKM